MKRSTLLLKNGKKQNIFKNLEEYIELVKSIRSQYFDIAIDTQGLFFKSYIVLF